MWQIKQVQLPKGQNQRSQIEKFSKTEENFPERNIWSHSKLSNFADSSDKTETRQPAAAAG